MNILWARRPEDPILELRSRAPRTWQEAVQSGHVVPMRRSRRGPESPARWAIFGITALVVGGWCAAFLLGARWWLLLPWSLVCFALVAILDAVWQS
jgi:hypothetical protein